MRDIKRSGIYELNLLILGCERWDEGAENSNLKLFLYYSYFYAGFKPCLELIHFSNKQI